MPQRAPASICRSHAARARARRAAPGSCAARSRRSRTLRASTGSSGKAYSSRASRTRRRPRSSSTTTRGEAMAFENIRFEQTDGVARLTLHRPERLNSFNVAMHEEVRGVLEKLRTDPAARVLVLTGAGRGFCAGQDLGDRAVAPGAGPADLGESIELRYKPLILSLRTFLMPVVAAVTGVAAGAE